MLAELEALRRSLTSQEKSSPEGTDDGLVILRLCPEMNLADWEIISRREELRDWLAMPLSANPMPFLTHIQETLNELVFLSEHDPLTKLYNRIAFERILSAELTRASRVGQSLALVQFEIDGFQAINAAYGHSCGDRILESIGELLLSEKRTYDYAARIGNNAFSLLLPSVGLVRAEMISERVLEAARSLDIVCDSPDTPHHITLSAGLACTKGKIATTSEKLHELAGEALHKAKAAGTGRLIAAPILDLTGPPEKTLVRADEKRFLFTGLTKG